MGILGVTFIVLLILKLAAVGVVASLSWWWIFAPLILAALVRVILVIIAEIVS